MPCHQTWSKVNIYHWKGAVANVSLLAANWPALRPEGSCEIPAAAAPTRHSVRRQRAAINDITHVTMCLHQYRRKIFKQSHTLLVRRKHLRDTAIFALSSAGGKAGTTQRSVDFDQSALRLISTSFCITIQSQSHLLTRDWGGRKRKRESRTRLRCHFVRKTKHAEWNKKKIRKKRKHNNGVY